MVLCPESMKRLPRLADNVLSCHQPGFCSGGAPVSAFQHNTFCFSANYTAEEPFASMWVTVIDNWPRLTITCHGLKNYRFFDKHRRENLKCARLYPDNSNYDQQISPKLFRHFPLFLNWSVLFCSLCGRVQAQQMSLRVFISCFFLIQDQRSGDFVCFSLRWATLNLWKRLEGSAAGGDPSPGPRSSNYESRSDAVFKGDGLSVCADQRHVVHDQRRAKKRPQPGKPDLPSWVFSSYVGAVLCYLCATLADSKLKCLDHSGY